MNLYRKQIKKGGNTGEEIRQSLSLERIYEFPCLRSISCLQNIIFSTWLYLERGWTEKKKTDKIEEKKNDYLNILNMKSYQDVCWWS